MKMLAHCLECNKEAKLGEVIVYLGVGLWMHEKCAEQLKSPDGKKQLTMERWAQ